MEKNVLDCLEKRGFIEAVTSPDLREHLEKPRSVYVGFDPTADSLHLGHLVGILALAWCQKFGHTPCVILGGATGRIGDPSGRSLERPLLSEEAIQENVKTLEHFFRAILKTQNGVSPKFYNNETWLGKMSMIEFLRDVGKYFRVGPMLSKESVKVRLESEEGISYTEFTYQILQGYDFHYLNKHERVSVQMGGSDQWGNITAGIEFHRKMGGEPIYGMTFPLIVRSDGKKFGKSEGGAVWLSSHRLSPYQFYQYLVRIPDADVIRMLKILTFLSLKEIAHIEEKMKSQEMEPNFAQKILASEVTRFVHGEEGLEAALKVTSGLNPGSEAILNADLLAELAKDMPHAELNQEDIIGKKFIDVAAQLALVPSKSEGVRLIKNGGAYLNNKKIEDPMRLMNSSDLIDGKFLLLSVGKKKRMLVTVLFV